MGNTRHALASRSRLSNVGFVSLVTLAACAGKIDDPPASGVDAAVADAAPQPIDAPTTTFSFFVTSTGGPSGGDLRRTPADTDGLAGADEICRTKAIAAVPAAASKTWRAYLSTAAVNARDRIGTGPWFNKNGVMVAESVANLHDPNATTVTNATALDETGATVAANVHDIITGSNAMGNAAATHCNNWTSSAANVTAQVGHHDRTNNSSWNSAHVSQGCAPDSLAATGGRGSFFCFGF